MRELDNNNVYKHARLSSCPSLSLSRLIAPSTKFDQFQCSCFCWILIKTKVVFNPSYMTLLMKLSITSFDRFTLDSTNVTLFHPFTLKEPLLLKIIQLKRKKKSIFIWVKNRDNTYKLFNPYVPLYLCRASQSHAHLSLVFTCLYLYLSSSSSLYNLSLFFEE